MHLPDLMVHHKSSDYKNSQEQSYIYLFFGTLVRTIWCKILSLGILRTIWSGRNVHKGCPIFFSIFGDTHVLCTMYHLPMYYVRFSLTYLVPTHPKLVILYGRSLLNYIIELHSFELMLYPLKVPKPTTFDLV